MRIKPLVVLSLVSLVRSLSQAADTVASLGDSIKATQFVTAVDHTKLVNGPTSVVANQDGTASIEVLSQESWVITSVSGTCDLRYTGSGGSIGVYSGQNNDALKYRLTFTEDPVSLSDGDTADVVVELLRDEGNGSSLLWKSPIRFSVSDDSAPGLIRLEGAGILKGMPANMYADNEIEPDGTRIGEDFSRMYVGQYTTFMIIDTVTPTIFGFTLAGPISWNGGSIEHTGGSSSKTIATTDQIPSVPTLATVATSGSYNDLLNKPINVSVFNNDAGYVKTNVVGSLVTGPFNANQSSGAWSAVISGGGANNESEGSIIVGPSSHIYPNSPYSSIFAPGASIKSNSGYSQVFGPSTIDENSPYSSIHGGGGSYIKSSYSHIFGGSALVETNCMSSFVIGNSGHSTNSCTFLWTAHSIGNKSLPAAPVTHGDGTFNINTFDGVAGVYIGDTNLQQIIRLEAKAMIRDAVSVVNTNIQTAEDARVALTNLITILKNL